MTKREIRKEKIEKRKSIENRQQKDKKIAEMLIESDFYKKAQTIMVYMSYNGEVSTDELIEIMLKDGKTLCAPVCIDKETMIAKSFTQISEFSKGMYGIKEPKGEKVSDIDLVIVPGVAFNEEKHRIGYGAGYYDRFLENTNAISCGLFYQMQKADFTADETDKKLDYVITEERNY